MNFEQIKQGIASPAPRQSEMETILQQMIALHARASRARGALQGQLDGALGIEDGRFAQEAPGADSSNMLAAIKSVIHAVDYEVGLVERETARLSQLC